MLRGFLGVLLMIVALTLATRAGPSHSSEEDEYRVQAAFMFNFAKFVQWPESIFSSPTAPLILGILGRDPFGTNVSGLARSTVQGRPLEVRQISEDSGAAGCHLLYVSRSEQARVGSILTALAGKSILTVSECPGFARAGGIVEFVIVNDTVRFKVNLEAARRHELKPSSQLLGVAVEVISK